MQKLSKEVYQKTVRQNKIFNRLDKKFQARILDADEDRHDFYLDLLQTIEQDFMKASQQFYEETIDIVRRYQHDNLKAKRVVANTVEGKTRKEEAPHLEEMITAIADGHL